MANKILFLLKQTDVYGSYSSNTSKSGLLNSARLTASQITKYLSIPTQVDVLVDGNEVDKYIHNYSPTIVIIEALWVTPDKLTELVKLYPKIIFVVLLHSKVAFLSNEGIAIEWVKEYVQIKNVFVGFNSLDAYADFYEIGIFGIFLPNIFQDVYLLTNQKPPYIAGNPLDIGCFGAIRPFKNQLLQAMAALVLAKQLNATLNFHINSTRPEQGGDSTLKNIRALFDGLPTAKLIEHEWEERVDFLTLVQSMDVCLQVSFSETFNIVAADCVLENIPCVVSSQVDWIPVNQQASVYNINDIANKMLHALRNNPSVIKQNVKALTKFNTNSLGIWNKFLKTTA